MDLLTRTEVMAKLRIKPAFFSKVTNGKVKGLPRLPCIKIGRRQLFRKEAVEKWVEEQEVRSCKEAH